MNRLLFAWTGKNPRSKLNNPNTTDDTMSFSISPIGIIHSPYKQKFAVPRQPRLVSQARASVELLPPFDQADAFSGIEEFSHLWLLFIFHQNIEQGWSNQVRPPRLGGNSKKGVFATRSSFRPNPVGMSAVEFFGLRKDNGKLYLDIGGVDLVDGTPIVDIKPYIPYSDQIEDANGGFANEQPSADMEVRFEPEVLVACEKYRAQYPQLVSFISQVLKQDPRPAYKKNKNETQEYAVYLYEFNVRWRVENGVTHVVALEPI